jgi:hypothetical protein
MDGRRADFETPNGKKVELKYESRTTAQTPNVALEVYSGHGIGAIARAVEHGMDYIIFMYSDGQYFVYSPAKLLQFMNQPKLNYRVVSVSNPRYETIVMLVPRADLKECEIGLEE